MRDEDNLTFDDLADRLRDLRDQAGLPSYNEIVVRIAAARERDGVSPDAARPARTTVYDAFRTGRRRLDPQLVGAIVQALGGDRAAVEEWEESVRRARPADKQSSPAAPPETITEPVSEPVPGRCGPARAPLPPGPRLLIAILLGSLGLNLLGRIVVDLLGLTIYLDMVGTAIAAVVLGPWWGALVGVVTNLVAIPISGEVSALFAPVNAIGALVWGYGVRRFGFGRSLPRYFVLNLLVAVACSAVAAPIILALNGEAQHHSDELVAQVADAIGLFAASLLTVNLLMSMLDKLISGFVALVAAEALGRPVWSARSGSSPEEGQRPAPD